MKNKNIIKTITFALLITTSITHAAEEQATGWWSSLKSGFNSVIGAVQKPASYINTAAAALFSAPYMANSLASLVTTSGAIDTATRSTAYVSSLTSGTASFLKPLVTTAGITNAASSLASNPNAQKVAAGLTAAATPYITTWILMYRAHGNFDDAIRLITPPVNITAIETEVNNMNNDNSEILDKIRKTRDADNPAKQSSENFIAWCNEVAGLNNNIIKNTQAVHAELNKNKSSNPLVTALARKINDIIQINTDFKNKIDGTLTIDAANYSPRTALEYILALSGFSITRQAAINALNPATSPTSPIAILKKEYSEFNNKDETAKLLTLARQKYNASASTRTRTPLTRYSDDLTWYINRLWYLQIFFLGTGKRTEIQQLIGNLKTIRAIITGTKEFKDEQN